ncbi:ribonuclease III [Devosia sp. XJ19-1]|uniref:Ribonuclease 3 n=1 Tax=Devosia ureilytica TaxID=2952754 RepID=A0A9Q4AKF0_9HYPH|nr:ribonuclease III [Devosia ureilytica]MCP8885589.1 ribonuclease III [Devosia ureilytica]
MSRRDKTHEKLQFRLGYRFADIMLLEHALTHSSAVSPGKRIERSYQRLEFLGDRVLGLVVADMLYQRYPKSNEGELSRLLNTLVRKETCADIARQLDLGSEMILGESEARSGGADKDAILGDATEAIIGAIYLDGGLEPARNFIERLFEEFLVDGQASRADAKTTLQEWAQARGLEPPDYMLVERTGPDHAPEFTIAVELAGFDRVQAIGPSKKIAEHRVAEQFLVRQNVWKERK